jgi:hypothetical protein
MKALGEYILVVDQAIPSELCERTIRLYDECDKTIQRDTEVYRFTELNINQEASFNECVAQLQSITQRVHDSYIKNTGSNFLPIEHGYEQHRMKKYEANDKDQFDWHTDVGDHASAKRYLVMFYYLNTVEDGGETLFHIGEIYSVKPKQGRVVCFPPNFMYPHKGSKPISGPKYIISTYGHYL